VAEGAEQQVLLHGQLGKQPPSLGHQGDAEVDDLFRRELGQVVGDAVDGESAVAAVRALRPEIVLLDVQLPDVDGFAVAEQLAEVAESSTIVLTSTRSAASLRWRLQSSAWRFIPKSELSGEALAAAVPG